MGYSRLDREGKWIYYKCLNCFCTAWYHESDQKKCKNCGKERLTQPLPPKDEMETEKRCRQLGAW